MIKSEPQSILQFVATHYEPIKDLFDLQVKHQSITHEALRNTLEHHERDIETQLLEYQILVEQNDDFAFHEPYFILFEFIHQKFKPLLPEEIEEYGESIKKLFTGIKQGINGDKNILLDRIEALSKQIKRFTHAVTNNTKSLLSESRELKANLKKIDYQEKIHQASYWIAHYIAPLTNILDVNHRQSIYNEIIRISDFTNKQRIGYYGEEGARRAFENLYHLIRQVEKDLNVQSVILTNELLPLIERLKTESQYLAGFHHYLTNGNCYKTILPPRILSPKRDNPYNPFIKETTKEYLEQFQHEEEVIIAPPDDSAPLADYWFFDKAEYKQKLNQALPVDDFFQWCKDAIRSERESFSFDHFFMVTGLLFEEEYEAEVDPVGGKTTLSDESFELIMPKLRIKKHESIS